MMTALQAPLDEGSIAPETNGANLLKILCPPR
jgi:hypothetical protein